MIRCRPIAVLAVMLASGVNAVPHALAQQAIVEGIARMAQGGAPVQFALVQLDLRVTSQPLMLPPVSVTVKADVCVPAKDLKEHPRLQTLWQQAPSELLSRCARPGTIPPGAPRERSHTPTRVSKRCGVRPSPSGPAQEFSGIGLCGPASWHRDGRSCHDEQNHH